MEKSFAKPSSVYFKWRHRKHIADIALSSVFRNRLKMAVARREMSIPCWNSYQVRLNTELKELNNVIQFEVASCTDMYQVHVFLFSFWIQPAFPCHLLFVFGHRSPPPSCGETCNLQKYTPWFLNACLAAHIFHNRGIYFLIHLVMTDLICIPHFGPN